MNYIFPIAYLSVTYSIVGILIVFGLMGKSELAAEIGIIQGATLATFYAFSGNARSLILNQRLPAGGILHSRLWLTLLLVLPAFGLSFIGEVDGWLAIAIILRRCIEWFNEVHLCQAEIENNRKYAVMFLSVQTILFLLVFVSPFFIWAWALIPIVFSLRRLPSGRIPFSTLLPHLGSTAICGCSIYLFRITTVLLAGKITAGDLFSAVAIGSFAGSLFANVLGPTMVLNGHGLTKPVKLTLGLFVIAGCAIFFNQHSVFEQALGLSLIGGALMVVAQHKRLRLIERGKDIFGIDILINIAFIISVPFLFYVVGTLAPIYLVNAVLSYVAYRYAEEKVENTAIKGLVILLLFTPLFLQLLGKVYNSATPMVDSGGDWRVLPIPIGLIACYMGIILLGNYKRAAFAFGLIFFSFVLMALTSIISASGHLMDSKVLLLIQFILPIFALALGQVVDDGNLTAKICFYLATILIPTQLLATWLQGKIVLTHNLYLFSIYQHFQYVPVMVGSAFLIALYTFGDRKIFYVLSPLMGIYIAASNSILAIFGVTLGVIGYLLFHRGRRAAVLAIAVVAFSAGYLQVSKSEYLGKYDAIKNMELPMNMAERLDHWAFYGSRVIESNQSFLFGHPAPPDRTVKKSAHNYYLDFLYNFGMIAALPLLILIGYTLFLSYQNRTTVLSSSSIFGLTAVVLFLVLVDNNFKVTLRQPYPGVITFFLWGILLNQLRNVRIRHRDPGGGEAFLRPPAR